MADTLAINVTQAAKATPVAYTVPGAVEVEPLSAFAHFDGTGAASSFRPTLTFYSDAGLILARVFPGETVAAGDTADVTFAPFLGSGALGSSGGLPVVSSGTFNPVGNLVPIVSVNSAAPTTIVAAASFQADGISQYRVDVAIATIDIQVNLGGTGAAFVTTAFRNATNLGGIADFNVVANAGVYGSVPLFASFLDTPPSGATVYTIGAYKLLGGGATATMLAYGNNIVPPPAGGTHAGYVAVYLVG